MDTTIVDMQNRAEEYARRISSIGGGSYELVSGSRRYKLISRGKIPWKQRGEQKWGNVHYADHRVWMALDYPVGAFGSDDFAEWLGLSYNKWSSITSFYITSCPQYDSLRIKLYEDKFKDEVLADRILQVANRLYAKAIGY